MAYQHYETWKKNPIGGHCHLSVVIPAYNESERIIPTIGAMASHISDLGFPWELIVADDGSTDDTIEAVQALGFANLRVLPTPQNQGKGNAVQRGMLAARGDYILFADADNSTPIEEADKFLSTLTQGNYDIAIGSRVVAGSEESQRSLARRIFSGGLRWMVQNIFQIGVQDTQCGFKMYTREAAHKLHSAQTLMGFSFDLEILYLAYKFGYSVVEIPVRWVDAPGSKVDPAKEAQRFLRDLIQIKTNDIRGVYTYAQDENRHDHHLSTGYRYAQ